MISQLQETGMPFISLYLLYIHIRGHRGVYNWGSTVITGLLSVSRGTISTLWEHGELLRYSPFVAL